MLWGLGGGGVLAELRSEQGSLEKVTEQSETNYEALT